VNAIQCVSYRVKERIAIHNLLRNRGPFSTMLQVSVASRPHSNNQLEAVNQKL